MKEVTLGQIERAVDSIRQAALDREPISGLTHCFYRYPARFSPSFAGACIEAFSRPGDVVLDPYMGGGTTVVEAMALGRQSVGCDINSLAVFVAGVKVTELSVSDRNAIARWATEIVPTLRCNTNLPALGWNDQACPRNMSLPSVRWLRKTIAVCLASIGDYLPTAKSRRFTRCVLLNVGQWALNGRRRIPRAAEFRQRVADTTAEMLAGAAELSEAIDPSTPRPLLRQQDAESIAEDTQVVEAGPADLVVTSPPYPGIHMLYHRWQVDGRKETDAPYWIADCRDGYGAVHYNFADRRRVAEQRYFDKAWRSFSAVRRVMRAGAVLVQMIAFSDPERQLRRYLKALERAGFHELRSPGKRRTWRRVPGRRWHANLKGQLPSSREVALIHAAD